MDGSEDLLESVTRKEILKLLAERNHRPSDLSRELGKDKSTIVEHLEMLRQGGLVERIEREGHKWIFYALSKNGQAYFPNRSKRVIYIAFAMLSLLGALFTFFSYMQPLASEQVFNATAAGNLGEADTLVSKAPSPTQQQVQETQPAQTRQFAQPDNSVYLYAGIALMAVFLAAAAQALLLKASEFVPPRMKK